LSPESRQNETIGYFFNGKETNTFKVGVSESIIDVFSGRERYLAAEIDITLFVTTVKALSMSKGFIVDGNWKLLNTN
jgi:uncharacterized lipoprotein YajG